MGFKPGYCPEAEKYYKETISLPMYPSLSADEQEKVMTVLEAVLT
jgi:dTDP-4-amino-4,6-dideoxygalactose transaminase